MHVRPAAPADGPALLELTRQTPMQADISLQIERDPDFFALSRARGRPTTVVAEVAGEIVGCASSIRRPGRLSSGIGEIGVLADLKVRPDQRRQGVARALLDALAEHEATRPPAVFIAATAVGNDAVDAVAQAFGAGRGLARLANFTSFQLLPMLPPRRTDTRQATQADHDELAALLHEFHRDRGLSCPFADGGLQAVLDASPDMDIGSYRVVEREGRLVAAVACWKPVSLKSTRIVSMPAGLLAFARTMRALSHALPLPRLPVPGEMLAFHYLRHPAHLPGHDDAMRALIRAEVDAARAARAHFALWTCADGDPLADFVRWTPHTTYRYQLVGGVSHPDALPELEALAQMLLYDDAALA